jgi:flagellar M-ring protein FliF
MDGRRPLDRWNDASRATRLTLALAALAVVALAVAAAVWALRDDYQPLFGDLDARDAAAIAAELERMKLPYKIGDDGSTILVDASAVHGTRLKIMGKGLDLKGSVGFEIFNNTDFGMTDFAQKINYQRALQGELARTIGALEEVRSARVHLVLPESGLLRKSTVRPKASVTLVLRGGRRLQPEQIQGIQRLVAAAVPEMEPAAVTVLDQQGVALSRRADPEAEAGLGGGRLEAKREIEAYLVRKAAAVLDQAFGPGRAIVSVDVVLDHDQVKVTREDVLPANAVLRRKETVQRQASEPAARQPGANSSEVEYQFGRKVEQIVSAPGSVRRISVGVLLPAGVGVPEVETLKQVIGMAVGLNAARGDALAFSWVGGRVQDPRAEAKVAPPRKRAAPPIETASVPAWTAAAAVLLLVALLFSLRRRQHRAKALSLEQREQMLGRLKVWIASSSPSQGGTQA